MNEPQDKNHKRRGPWLPQVEDTSGESNRKVDYLRKKWGHGGNMMTIADVIRRAIDEAYDKEKQQRKESPRQSA